MGFFSTVRKCRRGIYRISLLRNSPAILVLVSLSFARYKIKKLLYQLSRNFKYDLPCMNRCVRRGSRYWWSHEDRMSTLGTRADGSRFLLALGNRWTCPSWRLPCSPFRTVRTRHPSCDCGSSAVVNIHVHKLIEIKRVQMRIRRRKGGIY